MIRAVFYNKNKSCIGFSIEGHAGYARYGKDIVCSAVSALATNTINSIQTLTKDEIVVLAAEPGVMKMKIQNQSSKESQLLIRALQIGLLNIYEEYGNNYLQLYFKEV